MYRIRLARNLIASPRLAFRPNAFTRAGQVSWTRAKSSLTTADAELAAALQHEINYETESKEKEPELVSAFLQKSGFSIAQTGLMEDHVRLTKKYGTETIHVTFSMQDVVNSDELGMDDENLQEAQDTQSGKKDEKDDEFDESSDEEPNADDFNYSAPASVSIVIAKPSGQGLAIEAVLHDEGVTAEKLIPLENATLALSQTPEAEMARSNAYSGPAVSSLDEAVQTSVEKYLESRGIDSSLAEFIYEYVSYRENQSYCQWLEEVKLVLENR